MAIVEIGHAPGTDRMCKFIKDSGIPGEENYRYEKRKIRITDSTQEVIARNLG